MALPPGAEPGCDEVVEPVQLSGVGPLVAGGSVRASASSCYRQGPTHKFGTWYDQFGESGCVGCGRCIVWCPVGIDATEEPQALAEEATR
jgi:ferredoxin